MPKLLCSLCITKWVIADLVTVTVYDPDEPTVLIEGILFRAAYLGSTQIMSDSQPSRAIRMMQAQEAVGRIKVGSLYVCLDVGGSLPSNLS